MSPTRPPLLERVLHGRYRVDAHLAEGGMASVYQGHDLRLDRPVALKIMRPDLARDVDFVARFQREARSAAKLSHPHVVSVYDQGEDEGLVYLVMELVTGRNLRDIIYQDSPLSIRAATDIVDQVLAALSAAHGAGLIHRDIKPENVLTDASGAVKVADFGLARAITAGTMSRTTDVMWGTAAYLSPEQVQHGRADERTDVYAVGLLLYELLTGRKAFGGDSPIHVAFQHVHDAVPSVAPAMTGGAEQMDALIAQASALEPDERPTNAAQLRTLLTSVLADLTDADLDREPMAVFSPEPGEATAHEGSDADLTKPVHQVTTVAPVQPLAQAGAFARTTGNRVPRSARASAPATPPVDHTSSDGPQAAAARAGRGRRRLGVWLTVLLLLIGTAGAAGAWYFTAGPGIYSPMPDVVGETEADAATALDAVDLDATAVPAYSETADEGTVISASQEPGEPVRHGTDVELEVSQGPERYEVPDVAGMSVEEATEALEETKLAIGVPTEDFDDDVDVGLVLRSDPAPNDDPVPPQTVVDVVISAGPEPIDIPDVTDTALDEASQTLSEAGFEMETADDEVFDDDVPQGSVVRQDPSGGQGQRGDTITVTVSKGPELVTVPQVIGMQFREAKPLLEDLGLEVKREEIAQAFFGTVRFQSEGEGAQVPKGTEIVLSVL
ncbi:MAG: Stk1 family PASTA domain-containing Ser/Thr kinase [Ornithinimicrobium sp.]